MSKGIKSDRISESSIARMAGNIMAGFVGRPGTVAEIESMVPVAVDLARAIAAEVERTKPEEPTR